MLPENAQVHLLCRPVPQILCPLAATAQRLRGRVKSLLRLAGRLAAPALALAKKSTKPLASALWLR